MVLRRSHHHKSAMLIFLVRLCLYLWIIDGGAVFVRIPVGSTLVQRVLTCFYHQILSNTVSKICLSLFFLPARVKNSPYLFTA